LDWEIAKASLPVILKLLLGHLPILVIGKGLLENCFCSLSITFSQSNYFIGRVATPLLFRESWIELLGYPNNIWEKGKILEAIFFYIFS